MAKGDRSKIQWSIYTGRKHKATGFVFIQGSPYCDAEGSSEIIVCLYDSGINATPIISVEMDKNELFIQCSTRRVK